MTLDIHPITREALRLVSDSDPVWITPSKSSKAKHNGCHVIVNDKLRFGGEPLHGWCITELDDKFISLLFHSVWEKNGKLFDFTPHHSTKENRIHKSKPRLFLPDNKRKIVFIEEVEGKYRFEMWENIFWNTNSGGWRTANDARTLLDMTQTDIPEAKFTVSGKDRLERLC